MTPPNRGSGRKVEVAAFESAHAEGLAGFIREVWDSKATAASVLAAQERARHPVYVGAHAPTVLLRYDDVVVGHLTSLPERVSFGGRTTNVAWLVGFQVLPEYQNGPVGVLVAREMARIAPLSMCSMVLDAPLRIFKALGWKHVGTVPNQLLLLDGATFARRLDVARFSSSRALARMTKLARAVGIDRVAGATAAGLGRLWSGLVPGGGRFETTVMDAADWTARSEADALWARHAPEIAAGLVRDGTRVSTRFGSRAGRYVLVEAREEAALVGWLVLKRPREQGDERLGGLRVSPIADLMFPPARPAVAVALLRAAARFGRRDGFAHALLASTPHAATRALLRRCAYVSIPGNLHLVVHADVLPDPPPPFDAWWHARGDGDADQTF